MSGRTEHTCLVVRAHTAGIVCLCFFGLQPPLPPTAPARCAYWRHGRRQRVIGSCVSGLTSYLTRQVCLASYLTSLAV
eukprot:3357666-Rhodomonas_salina.1